MQFVIIFIMFLVYSLLCFYIGWNLKKWLISLHIFRWEKIYWTLFYFAAFSMFFGRIKYEFFSIFKIIGSYWMFFFEYGILFCLLANTVYWLTPFKNIKILGSVIISCIVVLFIWGTYNAYTPVVRELQINIHKKGEPMRIVVASDFHLGRFSSKKHLEKFVEFSNEANPDLVLLIGDIVDDDIKKVQEKNIGEVLKQLESTYGVYGVLGNHEYYGGQIPQVVEELKKADIDILMDETISIDNRYYLTGREDVTNKKRMNLNELAPESDALPWIVMNHTPDDLNEPLKAGADLHLSGHTHHGQLFPNNLITNLLFEVDYGHKVKDTMHVLVSSGYGFWGPPMRIGSRSELWIVDIQFEN